MLLKNQASSIISTYTADVSGVCSALFEFGGMCIMHDASGCNSTYNTHDEPRWYDFDSLVYISALTEMDAIMGNDQKLIDDITSSARELNPKFVAIAGTPIPSMIGTDLDAIALEVEENTGIKSFAIHSTGMNSYVMGASLAFETLVRNFALGDTKTNDLSINILGTTPLDFSVTGYVEDMYKFIEDGGIKIIAKLGMGASFDSLKEIGSAHANLVVSSTGLAAAKFLYEKFGTPYVIGAPCGREFSQKVIEKIKTAASTGKCLSAYTRASKSSDTYIIHDAVLANSLAEYAKEKRGITMNVICPPNTDSELMYSHIVTGENELREILKDAKRVIADPLFMPICPKDAEFIEFPHEAFSGRIYREKIPNLMNIL